MFTFAPCDNFLGMFKIVEYYIVHDANAEKLTEKVNEMIKQGWQPFGSMSAISTGTTAGVTTHLQPMVQYGEQAG